jgi:histidinol-phosphatase (PHP family)
MQSLTSVAHHEIEGNIMYTDSHNHTSEFSGDAAMTAEELFAAAIETGLDAVVITEHYEADYPHEIDKQLVFEIDRYFEAFQRWRDSVPGGLNIYSGIELGYQTHLTDSYNKLTSKNNFDSVILSNHLFRGKDPYFFRDCYLDLKETVYGDYLDELTDMVQSGTDFDIVGHYDYISRYAPYADSRFLYKDAPEAANRFLSAVVMSGKSLEINTRSINKNIAKGYQNAWPDRTLMGKYISLGGERVTLGSDSHDASTVGCLFAETAAYLYECGFRELTTYVGRNEIRTPIKHG